MKIISCGNFADIYANLLKSLVEEPDFVTTPRNLPINEIMNVCIELTNPLSNLFENKMRSVPKKYLAGELIWYFYGSNELQFIKKYSSFWAKIANSDHKTVNSAYGYLLFREKNIYDITEWEWAFRALIKDKNTRQAIIRFNKSYHSFDDNKDFVCAMNGLFVIRNNQLHFYSTRHFFEGLA